MILILVIKINDQLEAHPSPISTGVASQVVLVVLSFLLVGWTPLPQ